jgi:hypothetical protein
MHRSLVGEFDRSHGFDAEGPSPRAGAVVAASRLHGFPTHLRRRVTPPQLQSCRLAPRAPPPRFGSIRNPSASTHTTSIGATPAFASVWLNLRRLRLNFNHVDRRHAHLRLSSAQSAPPPPRLTPR